jgi:CHASE3 domain sensor protein
LIEDKDIEKVRNVNWLIDKLNRIVKMSEEERKEILGLLHAEAEKTAEEHRQGEHFMDEIEKYANTLNEEEKKLFYGDLKERWNHVLREESKRLSKLWK